MLLRQVLTPELVRECRDALAQCQWIDGVSTGSGSQKHAQNAVETEALTLAGAKVQRAVMHLQGFASAVLPVAATRPRFTRYPVGLGYSPHLDATFMHAAGRAEKLRSDVFVSVALSDTVTELPLVDTAGWCHAGGAVRRPEGTHQTTHAGDVLVGRADLLHSVEPITAGCRVVALFWVESRIRCPNQRDIMRELGEVPGMRAASVYGRLLRMWS